MAPSDLRFDQIDSAAPRSQDESSLLDMCGHFPMSLYSASPHGTKSLSDNGSNYRRMGHNF
jgi:hypothetical protein